MPDDAETKDGAAKNVAAADGPPDAETKEAAPAAPAGKGEAPIKKDGAGNGADGQPSGGAVKADAKPEPANEPAKETKAKDDGGGGGAADKKKEAAAQDPKQAAPDTAGEGGAAGEAKDAKDGGGGKGKDGAADKADKAAKPDKAADSGKAAAAGDAKAEPAAAAAEGDAAPPAKKQSAPAPAPAAKDEAAAKDAGAKKDDAKDAPPKEGEGKAPAAAGEGKDAGNKDTGAEEKKDGGAAKDDAAKKNSAPPPAAAAEGAAKGDAKDEAKAEAKDGAKDAAKDVATKDEPKAEAKAAAGAAEEGKDGKPAAAAAAEAPKEEAAAGGKADENSAAAAAPAEAGAAAAAAPPAAAAGALPAGFKGTYRVTELKVRDLAKATGFSEGKNDPFVKFALLDGAGAAKAEWQTKANAKKDKGVNVDWDEKELEGATLAWTEGSEAAAAPQLRVEVWEVRLFFFLLFRSLCSVSPFLPADVCVAVFVTRLLPCCFFPEPAKMYVIPNRIFHTLFTAMFVARC